MRNAFTGYTYQESVTSLLFSKMDVERKINSIEIEAIVEHKFDDLKIKSGRKEFNLQIKDIENIKLSDLKFSDDRVVINGNSHTLSATNNVIFFKDITIVPDCTIFGFPSYLFDGIYIVSIDRATVEEKINQLYKVDQHRRHILDQFFSECLDKRKFLITRNDLPPFHIYQMALTERSVKIARNILSTEKLLLIEGKPGVGKSHLVNVLNDKFKNNITYRFWVGNQDADLQERLIYKNFLLYFSKKFFRNLTTQDEDLIINEIAKRKKMLILDGLDHIENYNKNELQLFIEFINKAQENFKVIVLSRPLVNKQPWTKQTLGNWNKEETKKVLKQLYHIQEYSLLEKIFFITDGYPILVRYVAEQYKKNGTVPEDSKFDSIENYYDTLLTNQKSKQLLSLFICSRSFLMFSEISMFLDEWGTATVKEFFEEYPYLFDVKLNRISLFHDSFITYIRNSTQNYTLLLNRVGDVVSESMLLGEKRFLSRFSSFDISIVEKKKIVKYYSSIENFRSLMNGVVDFEAIQVFYNDLRDELNRIPADDLTVKEYYDLSLIINLVQRDHLSTLNEFYYTFVKSLLFHGYTEEDITSTRYLFSMLYYIKNNDATLLMNTTSNENFNTDHFYRELSNNINKETTFFQKHKKALRSERIKELLELEKEWEYRDAIKYILEDLYIHDESRGDFPELYQIANEFINGTENKAESNLSNIFYKRGVDSYYAGWILRDVKKNLLALGYIQESNEYLNLSLKEYLTKNKESGSFDMWVELLNYVRLALRVGKKVDIESVSLFFTKYYQRKDYTLSTLDTALTIFERRGYVNQLESLELIVKIQRVSEKGYRGLLSDYITQHPPEIIEYINSNFYVKDLSVSWFQLPVEYINVLPDKIYNMEINDVLRDNRYDKKVKYEDVQNIFKSNRYNNFIYDLNFLRYRITIPKGDPGIKFLKSNKIPFNIVEDEHHYPSSPVDEIFDSGIINSRNKNLPKVKALKSYEVASLSDGYYSTLADPNIYKRFGKRDIQKNIKLIIRNAMLGKIKSIDSYHYIWYFPGNILKILDDNDVVKNFEEYANSFKAFLELSMYDLKFDHVESTTK